MDFFFIITSLLKIAILLGVILFMVSYAVYAERRVSAFIQDRVGPNRVGPAGLFQPIADMFKLLLKEDFTPQATNTFYYWLAPCLAVMPAIITIAVVPFGSTLFGVPMVIADVNIGIFFVFAISSLGVYGIVIGGWASNSKYPFLGALRSAAQMVSYEVSIGFVIVTVLLCVGSLNLTDIVNAQHTGLGTMLGLPASFLDWHWLSLFPMFIIFFISALAETNRPPFDLPEAESELVAGFMVEYGSSPYMMFMLGEYAAVCLMCALTTILFLGGWLPPVDIWILNWVPGIIWFTLKACLVFFMFAMVKAFVPRYRYDQLMRLGWKVFLPLSLAMVVIVAFVLKLMGWA
jgi:NADH-quinone oxidoreductase subunit H